METARDFRTLRLFDLRPEEYILIRCVCGRVTQSGPGIIQRLTRLPSDTLIYDLQFRIRCEKCNARQGFEIILAWPKEPRGADDPRLEEVVIVAAVDSKPRAAQALPVSRDAHLIVPIGQPGAWDAEPDNQKSD